MIPRFICSVLLCGPVVGLGTVSCSSMNAARMRLANWQEGREERRLEREVAQAEKQLAEEAARAGTPAPAGLEDSIFLDYANPSGSLLDGALAGGGGGVAAGGRVSLPGGELPALPDWVMGEGTGGESEGPVFLDFPNPDVVGPVPGEAVVDAELVRAWAASISPVMGASLSEPLITAAMTARPNPTETAVEAHAAATDLQVLADAFAGRSTRTRTAGGTSELEHE